MIDNEIAVVLMMMSALAPAIAYLMMIDCWGQDGNDVSFLYLGPLKPLLDPRGLGRVVANSTGYFGSDFGRKSVYRYMGFDAGLYRSSVSLDNTRCRCTDTEFD